MSALPRSGSGQAITRTRSMTVHIVFLGRDLCTHFHFFFLSFPFLFENSRESLQASTSVSAAYCPEEWWDSVHHYWQHWVLQTRVQQGNSHSSLLLACWLYSLISSLHFFPLQDSEKLKLFVLIFAGWMFLHLRLLWCRLSCVYPLSLPKGYDFSFLRRSRLYETCGSTTEFTWTTQLTGGQTLAVCERE